MTTDDTDRSQWEQWLEEVRQYNATAGTLMGIAAAAVTVVWGWLLQQVVDAGARDDDPIAHYFAGAICATGLILAIWRVHARNTEDSVLGLISLVVRLEGRLGMEVTEGYCAFLRRKIRNVDGLSHAQLEVLVARLHSRRRLGIGPQWLLDCVCGVGLIGGVVAWLAMFVSEASAWHWVAVLLAAACGFGVLFKGAVSQIPPSAKNVTQAMRAEAIDRRHARPAVDMARDADGYVLHCLVPPELTPGATQEWAPHSFKRTFAAKSEAEAAAEGIKAQMTGVAEDLTRAWLARLDASAATSHPAPRPDSTADDLAVRAQVPPLVPPVLEGDPPAVDRDSEAASGGSVAPEAEEGTEAAKNGERRDETLE